MKYLLQYMEQQNIWRRMFGRPTLEMPLSPEQVQELAEGILGDLSPENLCCDGELRGAALDRKARMLNGAKQDLVDYAKMNGYTIKNPWADLR